MMVISERCPDNRFGLGAVEQMRFGLIRRAGAELGFDI